ncbi:MAG: hypothetical protein K2H33_02355 [Muribaculaceae bacterium]|nr:hypothetical protein [Muribaculaceae bacterium]MDE6118916.1 hypothetical protein [Muribaculaceae bacterium]MDE6316022.1 hypothetical protein [Muribaculaceae bacterium]
MKRKHLTHFLICVLMAGLLMPSMTSCSSMRGHWGLEGEYPGDGTYPPPGHIHHHKANNHKKHSKKHKKHKKHKKCHHCDF